LGEFKQITWHL